MPAKFSVAAIETAKQNLDALPAAAKETREVGLREAIRTLSPTIRKLMRKGYSRAMVLQLLKEQGMTVSLSTLKQYFREKGVAADEAEAHKLASPAVTKPFVPEVGRSLERSTSSVAPVAGRRADGQPAKGQ